MKNAIGIIGGMGPMASQLFYEMITEHTVAEKDQDHINPTAPCKQAFIRKPCLSRVWKLLPLIKTSKKK